MSRANNFGALKGRSPWLLAHAIGRPLVHACLACALAAAAGLSVGLTFPFSILVGIPLSAAVAQRLA